MPCLSVLLSSRCPSHLQYLDVLYLPARLYLELYGIIVQALVSTVPPFTSLELVAVPCSNPPQPNPSASQLPRPPPTAHVHVNLLP